MIEQALILIATLLLGYYLGTKRSPGQDVSAARATAEFIANKAKVAVLEREIAVGPVKRPSAHDLYVKNEPTQTKETKQAIEETLDLVPELAEAKKKVEAAKAAGSWIP